MRQPLKEQLIRIGGGHLLKEYNEQVARYSDELGEYLSQLRPTVKGWKFSIQRMTGTWEWNNRKFEDAIYATWGWEGKNNRIPYESSDGAHLGTGKLKLTPPKGEARFKGESKDEKEMKKDAKKYLNFMKKEFPKIEKKLLNPNWK